MRGRKAKSHSDTVDLDDSRIEQLILLAKRSSESAYCPYSGFRVGAAVLGTSGEVVVGWNVENASFGLTICAERNAVWRMNYIGGNKIMAVVIFTPTRKPSAPCGACRQVINEFGPSARIISACNGRVRLDENLAILLPHAFGPANLK